MAAPKNLKVKIDIDTSALNNALTTLAASANRVSMSMRKMGKTLAAKQMATNIKNASLVIGNVGGEAMIPDGALISTRQYRELAEKFSRCAQRMTMLLSLLSVDELKRMDLLPDTFDSTATLDRFDQATILQALDQRVDQYNEAHKRLTGKGKKVPDPGRVELTDDQFKFVMQARAAGIPAADILKELKEKRSKRTP